MPKRPPWKYSMSKEQVEQAEQEKFENFLDKIYDEYKHSELSYFERNLEVIYIICHCIIPQIRVDDWIALNIGQSSTMYGGSIWWKLKIQTVEYLLNWINVIFLLLLEGVFNVKIMWCKFCVPGIAVLYFNIVDVETAVASFRSLWYCCSYIRHSTSSKLMVRQSYIPYYCKAVSLSGL